MSKPFQRATELWVKLVPVQMTVTAAPPATAVLGEMLVSVGAGLLVPTRKAA